MLVGEALEVFLNIGWQQVFENIDVVDKQVGATLHQHLHTMLPEQDR